MSDPALPVKAAWLARLETALAGVADVYDEIPASAVHPYVALRAIQVIPEEADDDEAEEPDEGDIAFASEIYLEFDAWSERMDGSETGAIAALVRRALRARLKPEGWRVVIQHLESVQHTKDPDRELVRAACVLRLEVDPV